MKDPNSTEDILSEVGAQETPRPNQAGVSRRAFLKGGAATAIASGGLAETVSGGSASGGNAEEVAADQAGDTVLGPGAVSFGLLVNGTRHDVELEPRVTLLDALRDSIGVTGPKKVCDRATCGSCTVLVDGELMYSCTRLAIDCQGLSITTVEGLGSPESMHKVQRAFVEKDAQQCGFCTPGFVLAVSKLLSENPDPQEEEITRALGGNLCRCGTYGGIRKVLVAGSGHAPEEGRG